MELRDQHKIGLLPGQGGATPAPQNHVRLTIPAREALEAAGARVDKEQPDQLMLGVQTYTVALSKKIPIGLVVASSRVACAEGQCYFELLSLRMKNEPPYPNQSAPSVWRLLDFTGCPKCGAPLVWYEAGFVPGYRVCARKPHHHWIAVL